MVKAIRELKEILSSFGSARKKKTPYFREETSPVVRGLSMDTSKMD
jgi:hypothetical protein